MDSSTSGHARRRLRRLTAALAVAGLCTLSACTGSNGGSAQSRDGGHAPDTATITSPRNGATDVPAGTQLRVSGPEAASAQVTLTDDAGGTVSGGPGYDANTWVPKSELKYGTHYTATVTAGGKHSSISFTTMAEPNASNQVRVQSAMGDGQVFGIGMPFVLTLGHSVTKDQRAAVEKRLSVTSTPSQPGSWYWMSDHEIHYRPKSYWQPGTHLLLDAKTGGVPFGNGYYGRNDITVDASITPHSLEIVTDDKTHMLTVYQDGKATKKMPASLGRKGHESSSGAMVIMTRKPSEIFDSSLGTGGIPVNAPGGYKLLVYWTMRLTWSGQFIHAAPWSVASQGHTDVSHGCTNISTANAKWIYDNSHIGDPVTVKNTGKPLVWGNGWTDWNMSWADYQKGSALHG